MAWRGRPPGRAPAVGRIPDGPGTRPGLFGCFRPRQREILETRTDRAGWKTDIRRMGMKLGATAFLSATDYPKIPAPGPTGLHKAEFQFRKSGWPAAADTIAAFPESGRL